MKLHQLSLFIENKPRQLRSPIRILAEAGVNILTLCLADTQQFGILRMIVQDWQKAKAALEKGGCVVNVTEVIALEVPDHPGGLDDILAVIEEFSLNIEYTYSFTFRRGNRAVLVFRFEDMDAAVEAFQAKGINPVSSVEIYEQANV
ncbi:MAG TPA: amino acid-binding protein [Phycisphaerae bacterium]|nr:amino acid-binding protein [Phycisphaerae bacterium]HRR83887.1 amino acid-binding protein [Phycisphaerae bacterium]